MDFKCGKCGTFKPSYAVQANACECVECYCMTCWKSFFPKQYVKSTKIYYYYDDTEKLIKKEDEDVYVPSKLKYGICPICEISFGGRCNYTDEF